MISTLLGSIAGSELGRKVGKWALKNSGKFIGKTGKWAAEKLKHPEWADKAAAKAAKGAEIVGQILGDNNETSKQLQNASKELKGEKVELRGLNDSNNSSSSTNQVAQYTPPQIQPQTPYITRLHQSNFKRFTPHGYLTRKVRVQRRKRSLNASK